MYQNSESSVLSSSRVSYPYETIIASAPIQSFYENNDKKSTNTEDNLPIPSFQKQLPILFVFILGIFEILSGLTVLILEILIIYMAIGIWCGIIYGLAGCALIILVTLTDKERQQTSAVFIFQLVAFMFSITEILLHVNFYQKRCLTKINEPSREMSYQCQILLTQIATASFVLLNTICFVIIYCRITIIVLKQAHGTFNLSNALNITC